MCEPSESQTVLPATEDEEIILIHSNKLLFISYNNGARREEKREGRRERGRETWLPVLAAAEHSVVPTIPHTSVLHSRGAGAMEYPSRAVSTTRAGRVQQKKGEENLNEHNKFVLLVLSFVVVFVYTHVSLCLESLR